jgi:membrane protein
MKNAMEVPQPQEARTAEAPSVKAQRKFSVWRQFATLWRLNPRRLVALLIRAYSDWSDDNATRLGAALAYYTLFSIAPVLIVITGIVGFFVGQATAQAQISPWLQRFLSADGAQAAELMLKQHVTATGGIITTIVGLATLFLTTSAFVNEVRQSVNLVWRVQSPPATTGVLAVLRTMLTDRLYGFLMAVGAALLILLLFAINTAIAIAGSHFHGSLPLPAAVLHVINFVVSFLLLTAVFTLVYKSLPDGYVAWGDAAVGAVVTALLFDVGSQVLSLVVAQIAASPYGTAASVLALLAWVYYSAQVFFFGAELTRIFATTHGGGIVPVHRSLSRSGWHRPGGVGGSTVLPQGR